MENKYTSQRLSEKEAKQIGTALESLAAKGALTPEEVLNAAKKKTSPLHKHFTWDDTAAAHQYRLNQASWLIRHVQIHVETPDSSHVTRAFIRVDVTDAGDDEEVESKSQYVPLRTALDTPDYRASMLADAKRDLRQFQHKYSILSELAGVMKEIERLNEATQGMAAR